VLQVGAPSVEVNALRATLGARPLPYPLAGSVRGNLQCYGRLDAPVFAGRMDAVPLKSMETVAPVNSDFPGLDAAAMALQARHDAGEQAAVAYDRVAFKCAAV
jgi:hypothetical protein